MNKTNITLVIPTYNRERLFARLIKYLASEKWSHRIIVADSSIERVAQSNQKIINECRSVLSIDYFSGLDGESSLEKVQRLVSRVETEYIVMCADDDLLNPLAVEQSVRFLEQNLDYALCYGIYLIYGPRGSADPFYIREDFSADSMEEESSAMRWIALMSAYSAAFYGVHRTSDSVEVYNSCMKALSFKNVSGAMFEVLHSSLICIKGKVKRLPIFYSLRKGFPMSGGFETLITHPSFSMMYAAMREVIAAAIAKKDQVEVDSCYKIIDPLFVNFLRVAYPHNYDPIDNAEVRDLIIRRGQERGQTKDIASIINNSFAVFQQAMKHAIAAPEELALDVDQIKLLPTTQVSIGILMPNYNHVEHLPKALHELSAQMRPADQVVVIDDGSTDNSRALIRQWEGESTLNQAIYLSKNVGVNVAFAEASKLLKSDFFSSRSVDDTFFLDYLDKISIVLSAFPKTGLVCFQPLRHKVATGERFLGKQIASMVTHFSPEEAEQSLRHNYIWDAGVVWRTEDFRILQNSDWRMRWLQGLHISDVIALRRGFCYIPEALMEYNMREGSYSDGGKDPLRHAESFVASARDLVSDDKSDIFARCVRSGFLGLREQPQIPIAAVLNAPWKDGCKPLLLILHGLLVFLDFELKGSGIPADHESRKQILELVGWADSFSDNVDLKGVLAFLQKPLLQLGRNSKWHPDLVGFFACQYAQKGLHEKAFSLLRNELHGAVPTKAAMRTFVLVTGQTESRKVRDEKWLRAIDIMDKDVWFGMEYVRLLVKEGRLDNATDVANILISRDSEKDIYRELAEIISGFHNPHDSNLPIVHLDPTSLDLPARIHSCESSGGALERTTPVVVENPHRTANANGSSHRVLFMTEGWADHPGGSPTNSLHNILASFDASGLGTSENFFIEDVEDVDQTLLDRCFGSRPDLVVISVPTHHPKTPKLETYKKLKDAGFALAFIWWDAVNPFIMALADEVAPYCRLNIILDHNSFQRDDRYLAIWTPQDPMLYNDPHLERTIDVCFAGSMVGYEDRKNFLQSLKTSGIPVTQVGGQLEQNLPVEDYALHFKKSKISINFSMNRLGLYQSKGRAWEVAACGGVLLEQDNLETRKWWTPWVDYVPFSTGQELADRIRELLQDPEKLKVISSNAKRKFETLYNAKEWWSAIFVACKLDAQGTVKTDFLDGPAIAHADSDFFSEAEVLNIEALVSGYRKNPGDESIQSQLFELRQGLGTFLLEADPTDLKRLFAGDFGKAYRFLLHSCLQNEPLTAEETASFDEFSAARKASPGGDFDFRELLVSLLYRHAHSGFLPMALEKVPEWFLEDYLVFILYSPQGMMVVGEADRYFEHLLRWVREVHQRIEREPASKMTTLAATAFLSRLNLIPVYFTTADVRELMTLRARIMEFVLLKNGAVLDAKFPRRKAGIKKIKVGFLNAHFQPQTETYAALPMMRLDRSKFEINLFALHKGQGPLIDHCNKLSDRFVELPKSLAEQVATIRNAELDVLLIGTNVTAVTNPVAMLSLFRLAPIQISTNGSPMTTGMRYADGYLSARIPGFDGYTGQNTERLLLFDGPISGLDFSVDAQPPRISFTRRSFGIPEDVIVFSSGSNFFKILPELQETWAKVLKRVEGSRLLLHPFNPNWSNAYPIKKFERSMRDVFRRHGIEENRLIISTALLPTRADVRNLVSVGDVYLDSYPLSGFVSLVDPLESAVPPVVWHGETFRSLLAASLLADFGVSELVTGNEADYVDLAVRLATDVEFRNGIRDRIRKHVEKGPMVFDSVEYGKRIGQVLEDLVIKERETEEMPDNKEIMRRAGVSLAAGRLGEAEDLCRLVLERAPETAACWALLGELSRRAGDFDYATDLMNQALELQPEKAAYWCTLGEIRRENKDLDGALAALQRAVEIRSNVATVWLSLAIVQDERKEAGEAERAYNQALRYSKDRVETAQIRINFAGFLREQKRINEGIKHLRKAISDVPESVETWLLLGSFLREGGEFLDSISTFARISKKFPTEGKCWLEWGKVLIQIEKPEEALEKIRKAASLLPSDPAALFNLGYALQKNLQRTEALKVYLEAEKVGCDTADLHTNIGVILKDQEQFLEAVKRFHRALELNPESSAALNNIGSVCISLGWTTEAIDIFHDALRRSPTMVAPHNNLGHMLKISGRAAEGLAYYVKGLKLAPDNREMMQNYLLCTLYQTDLSPQMIFEEHRKCGAQIAAGTKRVPHRNVGDGHPQGKIRVGYVSPDFCMHPVAFFAVALLGSLDRERFEVYAYSDVHKADAMTKRLRGFVDVWREISEMQNQDVGELIQKDEIDILVDLCGHTAHNRLAVMAARPAPIIASYLGYPATSGIPGVGFRITDAVVDPPGKTDEWHTEKLVRLDRCAWCFEAPASSPLVGPLPATKNGFITFGCFNNLAKLNAPLYDLWVEILQQVPDSRLFLKAKTLVDPAICQEVIGYFTTRGIALDRLRVSGFEAVAQNHFERYNEVDMALDSYPYHGTTTTCEALWMGVPVITQAGEAHLSRVGASLLGAVGHPELVASSAKEYIRKAVELAGDMQRLDALRQSLRGEMQASPLLDKIGFGRAIEKAFHAMMTANSSQHGG